MIFFLNYDLSGLVLNLGKVNEGINTAVSMRYLEKFEDLYNVITYQGLFYLNDNAKQAILNNICLAQNKIFIFYVFVKFKKLALNCFL